MISSRKYRAIGLNTNNHVYGALSILECNIAVIHTYETTQEDGEEDVGGIDFIFGCEYVDIYSIEENINGEWIQLPFNTDSNHPSQLQS